MHVIAALFRLLTRNEPAARIREPKIYLCTEWERQLQRLQQRTRAAQAKVAAKTQRTTLSEINRTNWEMQITFAYWSATTINSLKAKRPTTTNQSENLFLLNQRRDKHHTANAKHAESIKMMQSNRMAHHKKSTAGNRRWPIKTVGANGATINKSPHRWFSPISPIHSAVFVDTHSVELKQFNGTQATRWYNNNMTLNTLCF